MRKYFAIFLSVCVLVSLVALTGCSLWGYDDDDDVVAPTGVPFNFKGNLGGVDPSVRAAITISGANLKAFVYGVTNGAEAQVAGPFDIEPSDGSYTCAFNANPGYFLIVIKSEDADKANFRMERTLGNCTAEKNTLDSLVVDKTTTAVALFIKERGYEDDPQAEAYDQTVIEALPGFAATVTAIENAVASEDGAINIAATGVEVSSTTATINIGKSQTFTAEVVPVTATEKPAIVWSITKGANLITLNTSTGVVTGVAEGDAEITATAGAFSKTIAITVKRVAATAITITGGTTKTIANGSSVTLAATLTPADSTDTIAWSVKSGAEFVDVDPKTGKVTAKAIGNAVVTATAGTVTVDVAVTVEAVIVPVSTVTIGGKVASINVGQTANLTVAVAPEDASNKAVTWTLSSGGDTKIELTKTGDFTATIKGLAVTTSAVTVTATADGKTDSFTVSVNAAEVAPISLSGSVTTGTTTGMQIKITGISAADETALEANTNIKVTLSAGGTPYDLTVDSTISPLVAGVVMKANTLNLATFDSFNSLLFNENLPAGYAISVTQGGVEVATNN